MIDSYKNIERLRYRLNSDLNEIKETIDSNSNIWYEEMLTQISSAIISAMAAGAITSFGFSGIKCILEGLVRKICTSDIICSIVAWMLTALIFVVVYVLIFVFIKIILDKVRYAKKRHDIIRQQMIDYKKEFDNIACDSIFVAFEYRKNYKYNFIDSKELKIFYFYEIVHYLEKACSTTRDLCKYGDKYIKTSNQPDGVDIYRIYNMINLIDEILNFVKDEQEKINTRVEHKEKIRNEIDKIGMVLQEEIRNVVDKIEQ